MMTILEARQAKYRLERSIAQLIQQFEAQTELRVEEIKIKPFLIAHGSRRPIVIEAEVQLLSAREEIEQEGYCAPNNS